MSFIGLIVVNVVLLLLIVLGLAVVVLGERVERRTVVGVVVIGLSLFLLILFCAGVGGVGWYLLQRARAPAPVSVSPPASVAATTPTPLPLAPPTSVGLVPESAAVAPGESITVTIYVTDVTDLYGVEVHLLHDDDLSVDDLVPGTCASGFIATPETAEGRIEFIAARMAPDPPFSGDCWVATFIVTGELSGVHVISFEKVILADVGGDAIPATIGDGSVVVVAPAPQPTATPAASRPVDWGAPLEISASWRRLPLRTASVSFLQEALYRPRASAAMARSSSIRSSSAPPR